MFKKWRLGAKSTWRGNASQKTAHPIGARAAGEYHQLLYVSAFRAPKCPLYPPKADIRERDRHVRFGPIADTTSLHQRERHLEGMARGRIFELSARGKNGPSVSNFPPK